MFYKEMGKLQFYLWSEFILRGPWMSEPEFIAIQQLAVDVFQSERTKSGEMI